MKMIKVILLITALVATSYAWDQYCDDDHYYGEWCDEECPDYCCHGTCYSDGTCDAGTCCDKGYWGDECEKECGDGCYHNECEYDDGYCDCEDNYYGEPSNDHESYELYCHSECPANCGGHGCNRWSGECYYCQPGYYGEHCDQLCPGTCSDNECNQYDGSCGKHGCEDGFYGHSCENECSDNCKGAGIPFKNSDFETGDATGWKSNSVSTRPEVRKSLEGVSAPEGEYMGVLNQDQAENSRTKSFTVPAHTHTLSMKVNVVQLSLRTNEDDDRILIRVGGAGSDKIIDERFAFRTLRDDGAFVETTSTGSRSTGWRTLLFDVSAVAGNDDDECDIRFVFSVKDDPVFGEFTYLLIDDLKFIGDCDEYDGSCFDCTSGYYGEHCDYECPDNCAYGKCDKHTGECHECVDGKWDSDCEKDCADGCYDGTCDQSNGFCDCKDGYYGEPSNDHETYELYCHTPCAENCADHTCDRWDGYCYCKDGYTGDDSKEQCADECPENCTSAGCDKWSQSCWECEDGYYGKKCNRECAEGCKGGECYRDGTCDCKHGYKGERCDRLAH